KYMRAGKPRHLRQRVNDSAYSIVAQYQTEYRGVVQYYRMAYNLHQLQQLKWVMETSQTRTLARKRKTSGAKTYSGYQRRAAMGQDHGGTASQDARCLSGLSPRHSIWLLRWACTLEQESLESHVIRKAVMRGSEEGRWKSTHLGNSLAAYPTARTVPRGGKC